jgi:uncharacterized damage-inducible protein DinB
MDIADARFLIDHLYWMRDRVLTRADEPGVALTDPTPPTTRDLRATLVHELDVEWSWRVRLQRDDPTAFSPDDEELDPADFATLDGIRDRWREDEAEMRAWLDTLTDAELAARCRAERDLEHPFWHHLQHLYTHGIQQLSDAATLLSLQGHSPGELDFLEFVEERAGGR